MSSQDQLVVASHEDLNRFELELSNEQMKNNFGLDTKNPKSEITIGPQLVVKVKVLAGLFAATVGCLTFAGAWPFAVLFAQPGTEIGRSADCAGAVTERVASAITAAIESSFFIIGFLFPLDSARWLTCDIKNYAVYLADLVSDTCRNLF